MKPRVLCAAVLIGSTVTGADRYVMPNGPTISPYDTWGKAAAMTSS